ncbi:MAG: hypothetical protein F6K35_34460 [Okeania sp. SIO2H7]|nr:hypothetical protein [Okeania sp. SIO2H7]
MEDLNQITFKAFIVSLSLLEKELPKAKQAELNQIGREIALGYAGLGKLDYFAETYQPLDDIYQQVRILMSDSKVERNKSDLAIIEEASTAKATEITNIVKAAESVDDKKLDELFLILQDINSVKAAQNKMKYLVVVSSENAVQIDE